MSDAAPVAPAALPAGAAPRRALARNAFHLLMGQGATMGLSVVLSALLGRTLGAAEFGLFYVVHTMTMFAYTFAEWGQGMYVVREVAREPRRSGELLASVLRFRTIAIALAFAPALLAAKAAGHGGRTLGLYAVFLAAFLPLSLVQGHGVVFRGRERMDLDALATVLSKLIVLAAVAGVLLAGGGLLPVFAAHGVAGAGSLAIAVVLARRNGIPWVRPSSHGVREILFGGAPIVALAVATGLQPYIDTILLTKLAPPVVLGWYAAARTFMNALVTPAAILAAAAYPRLSRAAGDTALLRREMAAAFRPLLAVGAFAAVGTYAFADLAVHAVYGAAAYGPAVPVVQAFAPALLLFFIDILVGHACVAAGRARPFAVAKLVSVAAGTVLGVVLVPVFQARLGNGAIGVVAAFGGAELVMIVAGLVLLPRGALARGVVVDMGRAIAAAAATLLVLRLAPGLTPLARVPLAALAFSIAAAAVGLLRPADLAGLAARLRRRTPSG
jgi:O-antigen/teichoic acid export membrane protein